jgi:transposase
MTKKTRRRIDAGLKAKIAPETLQATVTDLAHRYEVHPYQIYAWKEQLRIRPRALDPGVGREAETVHEREIEGLCTRRPGSSPDRRIVHRVAVSRLSPDDLRAERASVNRKRVQPDGIAALGPKPKTDKPATGYPSRVVRKDRPASAQPRRRIAQPTARYI